MSIFIINIILLPRVLISYRKSSVKEIFREELTKQEKSNQVGYLLIDSDINILDKNVDEVSQSFLKIINYDIEKGKFGKSCTAKRIDKMIYYYLILENDNEYEVLYFVDMKQFGFENSIQSVFLLVGVILAICYFIAATLIARKFTSPLRIMTEQVKDITVRSYKQPIRINRYDEIGELARSIEIMRQELYEQEQNQIQTFQYISHDLRTPLAVIKGYLESINDGIYSAEDISEPIGIALEEVERLDRRVNDILLLTKLESFYKDDGTKEAHPIKDVIEIVVKRLKIENRDIKWKLDLDSSKFNGQDDMWIVIFENILSNFIRYANKSISVEVKKNMITLRNDGEHIPDHLISKVFKPYEKGTSGNFGIGLAIVYRTLMNYGYNISVENEKNGVKFTIVKKSYVWDENKTKL